MHFSASQVETAEDCLRKWAWAKLDHVAAPPNVYATEGIDSHKETAEWLTNRTVPTRPHVQAILRYLPPPQVPGLLIEHRIDGTLEGLPYVGFCDLLHPPLKVYDHKFVKSLTWSKGADDLKDDVQATLYAAWALESWRVPFVDMQWTYGVKTTHSATPVTTRLTAKDIAPRLARTAETARKLALLRELKPSAIDVPYDASACEKYGGCPYKSQCNLQPQDRMKAIMSQSADEKNFFDKMRARKAGLSVVPAINPPAENSNLESRVSAPSGPSTPGVVTHTVPIVEPPKRRGRPRKDPIPDPGAILAGSEPVPAPTVVASKSVPIHTELQALESAWLAIQGLESTARKRVVGALVALVG